MGARERETLVMWGHTHAYNCVPVSEYNVVAVSAEDKETTDTVNEYSKKTLSAEFNIQLTVDRHTEHFSMQPYSWTLLRLNS